MKDGITPLTVWTYDEVGHTQDAKKEIKELFPDSKLPFETPKPTRLMEKILSLKYNKEALILDSFAGTASTGHAVMKLNKKDKGHRKFILIEMEEYANTITAERIKKAITGYNYIGNKKTELSTYPINLTTLKKANKIVQEFEKFKSDDRFEEINIESTKDYISIIGTEKIKEKIAGLGGAFDFYELGNSLFNKDGNINEAIEIEKLKQYIYYIETKTPLDLITHNDNKYYLGIKNDTIYYFYYEKNKLTTLDHKFLATMKTKAEQYVIYADNCLLTKEYMTHHNIVFKKIPRDITKF